MKTHIDMITKQIQTITLFQNKRKHTKKIIQDMKNNKSKLEKQKMIEPF